MKSDATVTVSACPPARTRLTDLGLLSLRLTAGGLLAGHGAQKLFGAFGGHGLRGTAGWLESMGLRPGKRWATMAGLSEFGGGGLLALGFLHPLGPVALQGAMATAARQVHGDKPIWATEGGAELPVLYGVTGLAMALAGPGRYSLDNLFQVKMPKLVMAGAVAATVGGIVVAERQMEAQKAEPAATTDQAAATTDQAAQPAAGEDRVIETRSAEWAVGSQPIDDTMPSGWSADATPPFSTTQPLDETAGEQM